MNFCKICGVQLEYNKLHICDAVEAVKQYWELEK